MKIGFVVNDVATELPGYTTTRLLAAARELNHEAWVMGVGDFVYSGTGAMQAHARAPRGKRKGAEKLLAEVQSDEASDLIDIAELDVLLLRNDPADDAADRPWAQTSGILFGHLASLRGVIVLNDPAHLAHAINKTYFEHFPVSIRPSTCITRDAATIKDFIADHEGYGVVKPLQGSGGHSVFLVRPDDKANLNQIIDAVLRDGYAVVQEYLPSAADGDIRFFMINGSPLMHDGHYAAFRRVNRSGDMRSNMSVGGEYEPAEITDELLHLADMVRPKLVNDGMYLVGLDIVGDKLMEVNVFSPGGLGSVEKVTGVEFAKVIIADLERKLRYRESSVLPLNNTILATL